MVERRKSSSSERQIDRLVYDGIRGIGIRRGNGRLRAQVGVLRAARVEAQQLGRGYGATCASMDAR
jgi:hypothetical protein